MLELARLGVATRPGYELRATSDADRALRARAAPVSSTEIRERIAAASRSTGCRPRWWPRNRDSTSTAQALTSAFAATVSPLSSLEQARRIAALARRSWPKTSSFSTCGPLRLHRLLRPRDRAQRAPDEGDLRRGARAAEARAGSPARVAGERGDWILADYLDVVLHVFTPEARAYYRLEDLWGDVPRSRSKPRRGGRQRYDIRRDPGAIAQLGERLAGSQKVAGSSPAGSTRLAQVRNLREQISTTR